MATPEIEAMQTLAGYAGTGGGGAVTMFLFWKLMEKKRSKEYEKNGADRRKSGGGNTELNGALSKIAEAVSVKVEIGNIAVTLKTLETNMGHIDTIVNESKENIGRIWDQMNQNANSISEIKGYLEGKGK